MRSVWGLDKGNNRKSKRLERKGIILASEYQQNLFRREKEQKKTER